MQNLAFSTKLATREGQEMGKDLSACAVCLFPAFAECTAPSHPTRNIPSSSVHSSALASDVIPFYSLP